MDTLIGLGQAGCNIVKEFSKYPQYECYYIDSDIRQEACFYKVEKQDNCEEYENNAPSFDGFFDNVTDNILFVVGGSGAISGLSLTVLEKIKDKNINVLYVQPDTQLLGELGRKQERLVQQILQQYARSGLFKMLYLVSNPSLEKIVNNVSILNYNKQLNELIVATTHMLNVFNHIEPIMNTFADLPETARIATIGIMDVKENEQKLFFPLEKVREMRYYYSINKGELEKEGNLLSNVKQNIKEVSTSGVRASYGIYASEYEQNYGYVIAYSSEIQNENFA
jgi:hypothetical protein